MKEPVDTSPFLEPAEFIDSTHPLILETVDEIGVLGLGLRERAVQLFRYVRDRILYEFGTKQNRADYVASNVLREQRGFCVQKAVLLCALGRAAKIPTALLLCDMKDHALPPRMVSLIGTDIMYHHGFSAFYLDGKWVKADATLSLDIVEKKGYRQVEFDGTADALLSSTTRDGRPHAEYIRIHGFYPDLPFDQMMEAFFEAYKNADAIKLAKMAHMLRTPKKGEKDGTHSA